jgi:hypothetical protein
MIVLGFFGIFWCSLIGGFDYVAIRDLVAQIGSAHFTATPAHIVRSEVTSHRGSKGGTTYGVRFEYTYAVNGSEYRASRYTFNVSSSSDEAWAREAVAAFPAGSERVCYYDPKNPARAVLAPGIHGSDLMILMFLTPFNIIGGFMISMPFWAWRERRQPAIVSPRVADSIHGREAYAMRRFNPIVSFMGWFLVSSFVGIFAVAIPMGFHPTIMKVITVWGTGFAIALGLTISRHFKMKSGCYDLVMDYSSRSITIPAMHQRTRVETIPMSDVREFGIADRLTGTGRNQRVMWQVKLVSRDDRDVVVQEGYLESEATRLAETLNAKLKR